MHLKIPLNKLSHHKSQTTATKDKNIFPDSSIDILQASKQATIPTQEKTK